MSQVVQNQPKSLSQFFAHSGTDRFLTQQLGARKGEFVSNIISLAEQDALLKECAPDALIKCAMNATALNLPLNKNLGYAYVIPYKNNRAGTVEPRFQIGWKGFVQLAIRSGQYKTLNSVEVREGEIKRNKFTGEIEFIGEYPENKVIGYLAFIKLLNGFEQSLYMSTEQVEAHADKYSKAFKLNNYQKLQKGEIPEKDMWKFSSPWYDDFDAMARKTVLKLLLNRYGILSTEMQQAITKDQTDSEGNYHDNPNNTARQVVDAEIIPQNEPEEEVTQEQPQPKVINLENL